jgi:sugar phosphate isomerase/epimerase
VSRAKVQFTVFTKSWKMPLPKLGKFIHGLGFDGIELPVRPGFQVEPEKVRRALPRAAKVLADFGVRISSVAGPTDEPTIEACAAAGAPIIRTMAPRSENYLADEAAQRKCFDALVPALAGAGVKIGVQNHCDDFVGSAIGLRYLLAGYDPAQIAAVWDPAHCAYAGEPPALALDILWDRLCLVNLKNGFWLRTNGPEAPVARWKCYWTTGRQGLADWPQVAQLLQARNYSGDLCLSAEFADADSTNRLIAEDLAFARELFA